MSACVSACSPNRCACCVCEQFWWSSPILHLRLFQLVLLYQSLYATIVVYYLLILHDVYFWIFLCFGWVQTERGATSDQRMLRRRSERFRKPDTFREQGD